MGGKINNIWEEKGDKIVERKHLVAILYFLMGQILLFSIRTKVPVGEKTKGNRNFEYRMKHWQRLKINMI